MPLSDMIVQMLGGTILTVRIFSLTIVTSIPLGLLITYVYIRKNDRKSNRLTRFMSWLMGGYILVMRGTPLLLQMFFIYYGLPYIPVIGKFLVFDRFSSCLVAFILNYAAYFAEIFRGGLLSVDKGQYDAAKALGVSQFKTQTGIVIPQMVKVVLPSVANEAITLVKDTALVTVLAQPELLHVTRSIVNSTANVIPFAVASLFYLVMSYFVTILFARLEKKYMFD